MSSNEEKPKGNWIECGRIGRPWGIKGQVNVFWNSGACPVGVGWVYTHEPDGGYVPHVVLSSRLHNGRSVVALEGITNPNDAKRLTNKKIYVPEESLPQLNKNEYYCYQILELDVETTSGKKIGKVVKIFSTGSNDIYEVKPPKGETILIPAIKSVIKKVDIEKNTMIIEPLEGMLD